MCFTFANDAQLIASTFVLVFSISFCLFLLTTNHLIRVYKWFISVAIVIWSYFLNESYVKYIEAKMNDSKFKEFSVNDGIFYTFFTNYLLQVRTRYHIAYCASLISSVTALRKQVTLSLAFIYVSGHGKTFVSSISAFFFILPCFTSLSFFLSHWY